ncbi:hypothetical protein VTN96DRAFT_4147 [Rasamsonia emersonii]
MPANSVARAAATREAGSSHGEWCLPPPQPEASAQPEEGAPAAGPPSRTQFPRGLAGASTALPSLGQQARAGTTHDSRSSSTPNPAITAAPSSALFPLLRSLPQAQTKPARPWSGCLSTVGCSTVPFCFAFAFFFFLFPIRSAALLGVSACLVCPPVDSLR